MISCLLRGMCSESPQRHGQAILSVRRSEYVVYMTILRQENVLSDHTLIQFKDPSSNDLQTNLALSEVLEPSHTLYTAFRILSFDP